jgi:hypothetical protein
VVTELDVNVCFIRICSEQRYVEDGLSLVLAVSQIVEQGLDLNVQPVSLCDTADH